MPSDQPQAQPAHPSPPARQKVWDAPTRLVHWLFVFCVAFSWWTVENDRMDWHYWSGLTLLGASAIFDQLQVVDYPWRASHRRTHRQSRTRSLV